MVNPNQNSRAQQQAQASLDAAINANHPRAMITVKQVLAKVPVSRTTLFRMERGKRFPQSVPVGGQKMYYADEVTAWQKALEAMQRHTKPAHLKQLDASRKSRTRTRRRAAS